LAQIPGKKGVPQTGRTRGTHIKVGSGLEIHQHSGDELAEIDLEKKEIRVVVPRQPYVPVAVYKTLAKMAYAIMPEDLCRKYAHLPGWLLNKQHRCEGAGFKPLKVLQQFIPGQMPIPGVRLLLFQRREDCAAVPYVIFLVAFANFCFQLPLPAVPGDIELGEFGMFFFPVSVGADGRYGRATGKVADFTDEAVTIGQEQRQTLCFESCSEVTKGIGTPLPRTGSDPSMGKAPAADLRHDARTDNG